MHQARLGLCLIQYSCILNVKAYRNECDCIKWSPELTEVKQPPFQMRSRTSQLDVGVSDLRAACTRSENYHANKWVGLGAPHRAWKRRCPGNPLSSIRKGLHVQSCHSWTTLCWNQSMLRLNQPGFQVMVTLRKALILLLVLAMSLHLGKRTAMIECTK